ncbi:hypothetical protein SAVCW2_28200 [Streptomyces avermitilis]|nr:hypothetical protein SAVCW2_28200 [Streptomyces avermitilis]
MQIRLTVVDPLGPPSEPRARAASCDVLVTAPAGTALAAVASGLASAVAGDGGAAQPERSRESGGGPVVLYAGAERLDAQRCTLGEPPLTDGAVLSLGAPVEPGPDVAAVTAELHVVAGPDAGGVHLLHGGQIQIGRSADADVPLDDPDVSRLHCAVTVAEDGRVSVADLGSTNGTTLDGRRVGDRAVRFAPGALLRLGESALRLAPPGGVEAVGTAPDGEGHVRVTDGGAPGSVGSGSVGAGRGAGASGGTAPGGAVPHARGGGGAGRGAPSGGASAAASGDGRPSGETHHAFGASAWGAAGAPLAPPREVPRAPRSTAPWSPVFPHRSCRGRAAPPGSRAGGRRSRAARARTGGPSPGPAGLLPEGPVTFPARTPVTCAGETPGTYPAETPVTFPAKAPARGATGAAARCRAKAPVGFRAMDTVKHTAGVPVRGTAEVPVKHTAEAAATRRIAAPATFPAEVPATIPAAFPDRAPVTGILEVPLRGPTVAPARGTARVPVRCRDRMTYVVGSLVRAPAKGPRCGAPTCRRARAGAGGSPRGRGG